MDRLRVAFAALLVVSVSLGGATAANFANRLQSVDTVGIVEDQITAELVDASLREDRFVATVRLHNPTGVDLRVRSAKLRVYNASDQRIASGAGERLDDNGATLPAKGSLTVTYAIGFNPEQGANLRGALRTEALLAMSVGLEYGDIAFSVNPTGMNVSREVR